MHPKSLLIPAKALAVALLLAGGFHASAQTVTKADNTTALNFGSSYVGGVAPTASDTIIIDNTLGNSTTTSRVSANMSVFGMQMNAVPVSGTARAFAISGGNSTLTIGAGGITKAANTSSLTLGDTVALGANQTWTVNAVTGTGTGNLILQSNITDGGFTANISGAGRIDITPTGTITFGNGVNLNASTVVVNSASTIVNLGNASQTDNFQIIKGRAIGSSLGNFGVASSFGDGGTSTAITLGGGTFGTDHGFFEYTGVSASSNRTFNFDRRSTGSEIRNTNAASTLTLTGNIQNNQGTGTIESAYSFGGAGNITLTTDQQLKDNTNAGNATTLNKNGTGTLTITGNNSNTNTTAGTYQGATNVNAGTLVVSGTGAINSTSGVTVADGATFNYSSSVALTKGVNVSNNGTMLIGSAGGNVTSAIILASGSRVGGDGTVANNLAIGSGVKFVFSLTDSLTVTGTTTFDNAFGFSSLVNVNGTAVVWGSVAEGAYTLLSAGSGSNFSNIQNFGLANSVDLGSGRSAYFSSASNNVLTLVVVPEPGTYALATLGLLGLLVVARNHRRAMR